MIIFVHHLYPNLALLIVIFIESINYSFSRFIEKRYVQNLESGDDPNTHLFQLFAYY